MSLFTKVKNHLNVVEKLSFLYQLFVLTGNFSAVVEWKTKCSSFLISENNTFKNGVISKETLLTFLKYKIFSYKRAIFSRVKMYLNMVKNLPFSF